MASSHVLLMVQPQEWQARTYPFDSAAMLPYSLSRTSTGMYGAQQVGALTLGNVYSDFSFLEVIHSATGSTEDVPYIGLVLC